MGYHHFHLGLTQTSAGYIERTDHVLFAEVTRDQLEVIGIFDHSVFDGPPKAMSTERRRLWEIFNERCTRGVLPGTVVAAPLIAMSGHPNYLIDVAQRYAYLVRETDPKLDDPSYVRGLYQKAGLPVPHKPKLHWRLQGLDLGLLDTERRLFFVSSYGPN